MMNQLKRLLSILVFLSAGFIMYGQASTTSALAGKIVDNNGQALAGATVLAIHAPSGTQYGALANNDGLYSIQGMRPGGPYIIEISFIGFAKKTFNDISLLLGESFLLNTSLDEASTQLKEVVVVGDRAPVFNSERNGASINISNRQLNVIPTVTRSINDLTRLTPQSNGNQIGGGNYRQNFITVDGAQFNNAFGIGTNLPGNGAPISLDAIDQISVNITPYDVRQSGFIGASVNAVTRSGSNEFSGSAYVYTQNEKFKGNKVGDADPFPKTSSDYLMQGFRFGGPILKNKLFFFVNLEKEKTTVPGPTRVAATASAPADYTNNIARPTASDLEMMSNYLSENYGYETGPYQGYSFESPALRILTRLDWNINNNHKFNIRYSYMSSKSPSNPSTSVSPFGSLYTGNRQSMDAMWYKNSGYFQERNFTSLSSELNSSFGGGKFMNTLRATYSFQDEPRSTVGKLFPFVDILNNGRPYTSFGTELFSYGNTREVSTITITDDFTFSLGINNFTVGLEYEHDNTKNGYQRFGTSFYVFNSWNDFVSGARPKDFGLTFSNEPGFAQAFPTFKYSQMSAYLQDEVVVNSQLKVTGGIRFDLPTYPEALPDHPIISSLSFGSQSFNSSALPSTKVMVSPRFGFNYDFSKDRSIVLRGGSGIFTGRIPFVWIVSQAGDAGMLQTTQNYSGNAVPANVTGFNPDPTAYYPNPQPAAGTRIPGTFTIISSDFKMPQTWKSSLALDAKLPFGIKGSIEGIYNKDINTAFFVNRGLKDPVQMAIAGYPDTRMIYPATTQTLPLINNYVDKYYQLHAGGVVVPATLPLPAATNGVSPIVLENRKGGYYWSTTAKLEKNFQKGFSGMVAYTHSEAKNLVDGSGDQPSSAWTGNANVDGANSVALSYTSYVIPDRVVSAVSYRIEYLKSMATSVSVLYEGASLGRYSYVYSGNITRDGAGSNNLIYVPNDESEIDFVNQTVDGNVWTADAQEAAFFAFIEQDKYLSTRKGMYAERNGAKLPWRNSFDVKIMQDFFINVAGKRNTIQVSLDILNVGNLLNKNWGIAEQLNQGNILTQTNVNNVTPTGTTRPTFRLNPYNNTMLAQTFSNNISYFSTYSMQLGVRYIFN